MRRSLLSLLVAVCACQFSMAQVAPPPVFATLLASDGNLYGINSSGQFFSYSPVTGQTNIIISAVNFTLCLNRSDGALLAINYPSANLQQFIKLSLTGQVTPIVQAPGQNNYLICPTLASDGNYYGSAAGGGAYGDGYLYQLTAAGKLNVFYNFTGKADGTAPTSTPVQAGDGNLYFFTSSGLLRYSPTTGLVVFPTGIPVVPYTPLEASDGNFYGISNTTNESAVVQVQPTGATEPIYNLTYGAGGPQIAGVFLTGSDLAVLTPIGGTNAVCYVPGDYYTMNALDLQGNLGSLLFTVGYAGDYLATYYPNLYQGGDGSYFGTVFEYTDTPDQQGDCTTNSTSYGVDYSTPAAPIQMTLNKSHVLPGNSAKLTWQVNNAFSKTLQQCYGFGALSGKVAFSGNITVSAPAVGSYTTAIVCGGTETGYATLTAGDAVLTLVGPSSVVPVGATATLTATVTNAGNDPPTGQVEFLYSTRVIASAPLVNSIATVTVSTAGLSTGTYSVAVSYPGDANYGPAKSSPISVQLVPRTATSLTLTPSTQTVNIGGVATLTAAATGTSPYATPTGTVKFLYGGTVLATVPVNYQSGFTVTAQLIQPTSGLPPGTYHVNAVYSGDAYNLPATAPAVTVILVKQHVTVTASPNPVPSGASFSLTAAVQGSPTPTGTVTFYAGTQAIASTSLNASGVATVTLPTGTLAPGSYQLTAYYAGDSHNPAATSPAITLTVN
jgi:hypothetical protein